MKAAHMFLLFFLTVLFTSARNGPYVVAEIVELNGNKKYQVITMQEFSRIAQEYGYKRGIFNRAKQIFKENWKREGKNLANCPVDMLTPQEISRKKVETDEGKAKAVAKKLSENYASNRQRMREAAAKSAASFNRNRNSRYRNQPKQSNKRPGSKGSKGDRDEQRMNPIMGEFSGLLDRMYAHKNSGVRQGTTQQFTPPERRKK